jgi:hypothetical protein
VLSDDFDGDGSPEIAAWTVAAPEAKDLSPGELWLFPSQGPSRKILEFPAFLPTGPECTPVAALSEPSPGALAIDVRVACSSGLIARAPTRAVMIVSTGADGGPRFGLRSADPAPGETLSLDIGVRDEDGDGRTDFRVNAALGLATKPPLVSAPLVFLDRAAGISRDAREPARTLLAAFKDETVRARQKKTAPAVLERVYGARRLLAAVCAEGATPRIFDWNGSAFPCSSLQDLVERLATLELSAQLALGDGLGALGVLTREAWYFGSLRQKARAQLVKDLEMKLRRASATRTLLTLGPRRLTTPGYSPLDFEPSGALLIDADSGVYRVGPGAAPAERVSEDAGPATWPREVTRSSGERLIGVSYSCDRSEVALLVVGGGAEPQVTSLLSPRPGVCGGKRFNDNFTLTPVDDEASFEVLVGGVLIGGGKTAPGNAPPRGSARSRNGRFLVAPTPLGLYLTGERSELWKIETWEGASASGCVVDNDGMRAACVRGARAELYVRGAEPGVQ